MRETRTAKGGKYLYRERRLLRKSRVARDVSKDKPTTITSGDTSRTNRFVAGGPIFLVFVDRRQRTNKHKQSHQDGNNQRDHRYHGPDPVIIRIRRVIVRLDRSRCLSLPLAQQKISEHVNLFFLPCETPGRRSSQHSFVAQVEPHYPIRLMKRTLKSLSGSRALCSVKETFAI